MEDISITEIRSPKARLNLSTKRFKPLVKTDAVSPATYSMSAQKAHFLFSKREAAYMFDKAKPNSCIATAGKQTAWVPAPSAYNTEKSSKFATIGLRRGYK